jgi:hypothetical protein
MNFYEDIEVGQRREVGAYTFTAEAIKKFAAKYDPQRFHLDEEEGRKSLFGGLAASGWHVGSVCMKMLVADGQRRMREAVAARREGRVVGAVAGLSRSALDQAGAGRRHHHLFDRHRIHADLGIASGLGHRADAHHGRKPARRRGLFGQGHRLPAAARCAEVTARSGQHGYRGYCAFPRN